MCFAAATAPTLYLSLDGHQMLTAECLKNSLVFAGVNNSPKSEATTFMIGCAEKQSLIRSRIDVFFEVINDFIILGTFKRLECHQKLIGDSPSISRGGGRQGHFRDQHDRFAGQGSVL